MAGHMFLSTPVFCSGTSVFVQHLWYILRLCLPGHNYSTHYLARSIVWTVSTLTASVMITYELVLAQLLMNRSVHPTSSTRLISPRGMGCMYFPKVPNAGISIKSNRSCWDSNPSLIVGKQTFYPFSHE